MSSPQYSARPPLRPESYRAAARRLREYADQLDQRAAAQSPQEKRALTLAVHGLAQYARNLSQRHRVSGDE